MKHLKNNNETYVRHLIFAAKVGINFIACGIFFIIHGIIPFIPIPKLFNFETMVHKINEWNDYTMERLRK
jgi:hypothetical protein